MHSIQNMEIMENKCEELQKQIEDKKEQIEILQKDIQELEANIERCLAGRFADILEKANTLLNKYYLYYNSCFDVFEFCYCNNVTKTSDGVNVDYRSVETAARVNIRYYEKNTITICSIEYFDRIVILNEEQAKEIYNEINKTVRGEQTTGDFCWYLKNMFNSIDE